MRKGLAIIAALLMVFSAQALAETEDVWELVTETGDHLTWICYAPEVGDEYIAADNHLYEIVRVDGQRAVVKDQGDVELPDVSWLEGDAALPVSATRNKLIALYCTHSDESYEPSDGTYSNEKRGSIYEVARALAEGLEENGAQTEVSDTLHHPHDAGAYRRSRQTAVQLMKSAPDAMLDIHRDGIPDPEEYTITLGGKDATKVRLLVGRGNQNMEANKDFALTVKAVADKVYPGLIKDIYMGKGTYNQDLMPHSILLECGTYTLKKERVLATMPMMADVLYRAMYGGVTGSAGVSDTRSSGSTAEAEDGITPGATDAPVAESSSGSGTGILWVAGIFLVGLIIYGIVSTGSLSGGMKKAGRDVNEMTGGLIGKKPEDDENPPD